MTATTMSLRLAFAKRLEAPDAETAMRRACALLLANAGQTRPPIRLKSLMGILSVPWDIDSFAKATNEVASLSFAGGTVTLRIDRASFKEHAGRARFSIAHEIGHLILYRALGANVFDEAEQNEDAYNEVEHLCDLAASHLLLPRTLLAEALRARGFTRSGVAALRAGFDVSETAALRAIADLLPSGAIIEWRKFRRRPAEDHEWRVWRTLRPGDAIEQRPWLPKGCTSKHIEGGVATLDCLPVDRATKLPGLKITLGRKATEFDAVAAKWEIPASTGSLPMEMGGKTPNVTFGEQRVLIAMGKPGYSDLSIFSEAA